MNQIQLQNLIIFSTNESMLQNPKNRFHWCLKQTIHHHPTIKSGQSQQQKPKIKPQKRRKKSKIQQEHTWSGKIKRIRIGDQWYPFLRSRAPVHPHGERRGAIVAVLRRASPRHRSINRCASPSSIWINGATIEESEGDAANEANRIGSSLRWGKSPKPSFSL